MNIYIVDDSSVICDRLAATFREKIDPVVIHTAADIHQVRIHLKEFLPDVMIIDIHLKVGSGFDVLELVTELKIAPLRLVLTNYALAPYKEKAIRLGADYFFDKSEGFNEAIEVVEKSASR